MKSKVSIIILNWNSWQETLLQAEAFTEKMLRNDRVPGIVVDG
jgi:hypothetical protein